MATIPPPTSGFHDKFDISLKKKQCLPEELSKSRGIDYGEMVDLWRSAYLGPTESARHDGSIALNYPRP